MKHLHTYSETKHHPRANKLQSRHASQILQQHRNTALSFDTQAAQSHTNPLTSQNSLLDTSVHSREKKSSSTHQNTGPSFPNQETLTSHRPAPPTARNLHNKEEPQTARIRKDHPKHSNINKMKRRRNTQQVKEKDKCPPNQRGRETESS